MAIVHKNRLVIVRIFEKMTFFFDLHGDFINLQFFDFNAYLGLGSEKYWKFHKILIIFEIPCTRVWLTPWIRMTIEKYSEGSTENFEFFLPIFLQVRNHLDRQSFYKCATTWIVNRFTSALPLGLLRTQKHV